MLNWALIFIVFLNLRFVFAGHMKYMYIVCYYPTFRFSHFARLHDVQTLAMLACVFQEHCRLFDAQQEQLGYPSNSGLNPSHVTTAKIIMNGSPPKRVQGQQTHHHVERDKTPSEKSSPISSSWHDVGEHDLAFPETEDPVQEEQSIHEGNRRYE